MTAAGDDQIVGGDHRSGVQHQAGDLLAQFASSGEFVIAEHLFNAMLHHPAQLFPQGLEAWLGQVGLTAAKGRDVGFIAPLHQGQHLIPLGHLHRALHRARHRRHRRLRLSRRDKIARARLGGD